MQVGFSVIDLTCLRYLVPFSIRLHEFMPDSGHVFYIYRNNKKYNGMSDDDNYRKCIAILEHYCPYATTTTDPSARVDVVVQVESGTMMRCDKRISIQHGYDYVTTVERLRGEVDTYICSSEMMRVDAAQRGINAIASPIPVSMWCIDDISTKLPDRTAFIFYPDNGDKAEAEFVVNSLMEAGYSPLVKQRRKHQPIACKGMHLYDHMWYPSEAIIMPIAADITIGFGSTAYTDIEQMGVPYLNVVLHSDGFPWSNLLHACGDNYRMVRSVDGIMDIVNALTSAGFKRRPIDVEQLNRFMLQLF